MTERKKATLLSDDELAKVSGGATHNSDGSRSDQDRMIKGGTDGSNAASSAGGGSSNLIAEGTPEDPIIFT